MWCFAGRMFGYLEATNLRMGSPNIHPSPGKFVWGTLVLLTTHSQKIKLTIAYNENFILIKIPKNVNNVPWCKLSINQIIQWLNLLPLMITYWSRTFLLYHDDLPPNYISMPTKLPLNGRSTSAVSRHPASVSECCNSLYMALTIFAL